MQEKTEKKHPRHSALPRILTRILTLVFFSYAFSIFGRSGIREWRHSREAIALDSTDAKIQWITENLRELRTRDYALTESTAREAALQQHLIYEAWPILPTETSRLRVALLEEPFVDPHCKVLKKSELHGVKIVGC
jgi:hypothetical protein